MNTTDERCGAAAFADSIIAAVRDSGSPACVGLDPVLGRLPDAIVGSDIERIETFCMGVLDAVAGIVGIIKPQSACFERYGSAGVAVLERVIARATDHNAVVIVDAKRGDIGISAEHYAASIVGMGAPSVTVNTYMGPETAEPYLDAGLGVFALVRTSNPGSDVIQSERLENGQTVAEMMAARVAELGATCIGQSGLSGVGAVIGATKGADAEAMRSLMPDQIFLVPGYGAQGGTVEDIARMKRASGFGGVVVNASRSVLYPKADAGQPWHDAVRVAATRLRDDLASLA